MMSDAKPKIWGIEIARPSGGFLGVSIGERTFVVRFYDQDKGGIPADVFRGSVRGREMGQVDEAAQEFLVLRASEGVLYSPARVFPPYNFKAQVNLVSAEGEVLETYVVNVLDLNRPAGMKDES